MSFSSLTFLGGQLNGQMSVAYKMTAPATSTGDLGLGIWIRVSASHRMLGSLDYSIRT